VEVLAPLSPPTLHLRSFEVKSIEVREGYINGDSNTSNRRVIVGVLPDILVRGKGLAVS
jgi:hypothetical protein